MKFKYIISLFLFNLLFSKLEYYLVDGIEKQIMNIDYNSEYSFYTKVSKPNIVRFTLLVPSFNNDYFIPLKLIIISFFEYTNRNSNSSNYKYENSIFGRDINGMCTFYCSYTIFSSLTNYVEFKFKPLSKFRYMISRVDILYQEYDLDYKIPLNIYNLSSNYSYYLFSEITNPNINISFLINKMIQKPFSGIYIHEFLNRNNSPSINITYKPISFTSNNDQLIASFSYTIKFPQLTKYIALNIKPSLNIEQIIAKYDNHLTIIDLSDNIWKTIDNLKNKEMYLFFIEATQYSKANISLIFNKTDYNPFNYIDIYEYETKNNSYSSYIRKNKYINQVTDNDSMTSVLYTVYSLEANYLAFSFILNTNIEHIHVKINVSGGSYELLNNTSKYKI